jgi:hypothetical protein
MRLKICFWSTKYYTAALLTACLALIPPSLIAQDNPDTSTDKIKIPSNIDDQWEYLVISYGKNTFSSAEKTLAYRPVGLVAKAMEATEIQQNLDVLGRFGWEVVTIVGTIGGDQQILLKRRYNKDRASNEALAILRGRELNLKDLVGILERARKIRDQPKLIELDEKEEEDRRIEFVELNKRKVDALIKLNGFNNLQSVSVNTSLGIEYLEIEMSFDVTETHLKNQNTYRRSEVAEWLEKVPISTIQKAYESQDFNVTVSAEAKIMFEGNLSTVGTKMASYFKGLGWN